MKITEIKKAVGKLFAHSNIYPDEPSTLFNYIYIESGKGQEAIDKINAVTPGAAMWVPACSHVYWDNIQVRR